MARLKKREIEVRIFFHDLDRLLSRMLESSKDAITGIAQAWADVAVLIEFAVLGGDDDVDVWVGGAQCVGAFGCSE